MAQYKSWLEELHREAEAEGGGELQAPRYWRKKRLGAWASAPRKRKRQRKREASREFDVRVDARAGMASAYGIGRGPSPPATGTSIP